MTNQNGKITLRHMEYSSLKSLHGELHHLLRPLITHAKKVQHHQRETRPREFIEWLRASPPGGKTCLGPSQGSRAKGKTRPRVLGDTNPQPHIFSPRSFCRLPYSISRRPRRHGLNRYDFIMGRWETPPRTPPGLSSSAWGCPLTILLKPRSLRYSSAPPFLAACPLGCVKAPPYPSASA